MSKSLFASKTFWVNVIAAATAVVSGQFGVIVPTEYTVGALAILNVLVRLVTVAEVFVPGFGPTSPAPPPTIQ